MRISLFRERPLPESLLQSLVNRLYQLPNWRDQYLMGAMWSNKQTPIVRVTYLLGLLSTGLKNGRSTIYADSKVRSGKNRMVPSPGDVDLCFEDGLR
jgi:hypothetical protein